MQIGKLLKQRQVSGAKRATTFVPVTALRRAVQHASQAGDVLAHAMAEMVESLLRTGRGSRPSLGRTVQQPISVVTVLRHHFEDEPSAL